MVAIATLFPARRRAKQLLLNSRRQKAMIKTTFLLVLLALGASAAATAPDKARDIKTEPEARYEAATVLDVKATVISVREVAKSEPLDGVYLTVKTETGAFKTDILEVYVGPVDFVKAFGITFAKGDQIQVIGSNVKVDGAALILAREVTRKETTLILRDKNGEPFWNHWTRPTRG
jgi:hypothetical protein